MKAKVIVRIPKTTYVEVEEVIDIEVSALDAWREDESVTDALVWEFVRSGDGHEIKNPAIREAAMFGHRDDVKVEIQ